MSTRIACDARLRYLIPCLEVLLLLIIIRIKSFKQPHGSHIAHGNHDGYGSFGGNDSKGAYSNKRPWGHFKEVKAGSKSSKFVRFEKNLKRK